MFTAPEVIRSLSSVLPDSDKATLADEFGEDVALGMREALRVSADGWLDDDLALVRPWGFEMSEVPVPTFLWQGDTDLVVRFAQPQWQSSRLP